jgi:hypothetical protein
VKAERITVFPGHEYSVELLQHQFEIKAEYEKVWYRLSPAILFETVSRFDEVYSPGISTFGLLCSLSESILHQSQMCSL